MALTWSQRHRSTGTEYTTTLNATLLSAEDRNSLFEYLDEGVLFINLLNQIEFLNQKAFLILRRHVTPASVTTLQELIQNSMIDWNDLITRFRKDRRNSFEEICTIPSDDRMMQIRLQHVYDHHRILIGMLAVYKDITYVWQQQKQQSDFFSMMIHELHNPLTPILDGLRLIQDPGTGTLNFTQNQCIRVVLDETERLSRLINDLLDINRLETGRIHIQREPLNIRDLLIKAITSVEIKARSKNITITLDAPSKESGCYADADRLLQVFINLLINAIKYSPPHTHTRIIVREWPSRTEIAVQDEGYGIEPSDIKKLFQRFSQLNYPEHVTSREQGSGLGLSIVKEIIRLHGGRVEVSSMPQKGSTFKIILPRRKRTRNADRFPSINSKLAIPTNGMKKRGKRYEAI